LRQLLPPILVFLLSIIVPAVKADPERDTPPRPTGCLFIIFDAARADHFSCYGYPRQTTPNIDSIAREGFLFHNAIAQGSSTKISVPSYLTGYYPRDLPGEGLIPGQAHTVAEAFLEAGFHTAGFSENPYVTSDFGIDQGFEHFKEYCSFADFQAGSEALIKIDTPGMYEDARQWIQSVSDERWFCYIHNLRPHNPYISPEPYHSKFTGPYKGPADGTTDTLFNLRFSATAEDVAHIKALYDGNLAYADAMMGNLIDWLRKSGLYENTLIIISSDHGEAFMDHGVLLHGLTVYEEEIRVPLIVRLPAGKETWRGQTDAQVELLDLPPFLARLFSLNGLHQPPQGILWQTMAGVRRGKHYAFSHSSFRHISVRTPQSKYITFFDENNEQILGRELYDLASDPKEKNNLLPAGQTNTFGESLISFYLSRKNPVAEGTGEESQIPAEKEEMLRALGYMR
jgi:arylsulfatase A-like enzyme